MLIKCRKKNIHMMVVNKEVVEVVSEVEDVVVHQLEVDDILFYIIVVSQDTLLEITKTRLRQVSIVRILIM